MNPNGCMTITAEYADVRRGRFSNISSLQLPIFFAALRPFFRIISRKGAKGTRSRQANFRRGMQNAQLSTTRTLSLPVLTPSRRCVPQTTRKPKTQDRRTKTKALLTAELRQPTRAKENQCRCHTPKFMNEKRAARRPLIHTTSTRQDAPRERHLRAPSGRQECYSYYVLLFVDFVLEFVLVDLAGTTLS